MSDLEDDYPCDGVVELSLVVEVPAGWSEQDIANAMTRWLRADEIAAQQTDDTRRRHPHGNRRAPGSPADWRVLNFYVEAKHVPGSGLFA